MTAPSAILLATNALHLAVCGLVGWLHAGLMSTLCFAAGFIVAEAAASLTLARHGLLTLQLVALVLQAMRRLALA